jgi:hypothetical protein
VAKEIAKTGPDPYESYGNAQSGRIQGDLLKFSKFGEWLAGKDAVKVPHGTRLVAEMPTLQIGWVRWHDGKPEATQMGFLADGFVPSNRSELGDTDRGLWSMDENGRPRDPWQFTNSLVLLNPETSEVYTFQPTSRGGLQAIGELCRLYGKHRRTEPAALPVVALDMSSYKHPNKAYGDIRIPVLRWVDWVQSDAVAKLPLDDETPPITAYEGEDRGGYSLNKSTDPWQAIASAEHNLR